MPAYRRSLFSALCGLLLGLLAPGALLAADPERGDARPTLRVAIDDNYPPYIFRDGNGALQGILKDRWALWERKSGVRVELLAMDWGKAQETLLAGQAEVIDTLFVTPARQQLYDFSPPYADIEVPIFFHRTLSGIGTPASLRGFNVGVKEGDACADYLQAAGVTSLHPYPSYETLVEAAMAEQVRVFCVDKPPGYFLLHRRGREADFRHGPPLYVGQFHWAVRKGDTATFRLVSDGFSQLSAAELQAIDERWLGAPVGKDWGAILWPSTYGLLAVLAGVLLLLGWNRALQRRVDSQTRELSEALDTIQQSETRFRALFETGSDAVVLMEGFGCVDCNRRALELHGASRSELLQRSPLDFAPLQQPDGESSADKAQRHVQLAREGSPQQFDWRIRRRDGREVDTRVDLRRVEAGGKLYLQAILHDLSERKAAQAQIARLASFDPLTHLPNRAQVQEHLQQAIERAGGRQYGALLCLDLDHFKTLNDTRGHAVGDRLLWEVASRLRSGSAGHELVGRLGGDEFVVLLEGLGEELALAEQQAGQVADKLLTILRQPFLLDSGDYHGSVSIGMCLFLGRAGENTAEILKRADAALYQAKKQGRDTFCLSNPATQVALEARVALENDLRRALPQGQLLLHFQPQLDHRRQIVGAEALLRWQHPQRGLVPPGEFIPLAEESGLILPIGQWVIHSACALLAAWQQQPATAGLRLSINVSARQFRELDFVDGVLWEIAQFRIRPELLLLELTESLVLDDVGDSISKMTRLQEAGVGFSMDDFGTGYSSLAYLKRLPLRELKIDQSFVRDLEAAGGNDDNDGSDGGAIVRTIIGMAHSLRLEVLAEGVETEAQWRFLVDNGCNLYQGYLLGRPLPLAQFEALLPDAG